MLLPFVVWLFDASVTSEVSYARFANAFVRRHQLRPGVVRQSSSCWRSSGPSCTIWFAGVRHVWMDVTHSVSKEQGRQSAI